MAAAPLAMMKAAITRSKSPLNRMMVFLLVSTIVLLRRRGSSQLPGNGLVLEVALVSRLFDLGDVSVLAHAHDPKDHLVGRPADHLGDLGHRERSLGHRLENPRPHEMLVPDDLPHLAVGHCWGGLVCVGAGAECGAHTPTPSMPSIMERICASV